MAACFGDTVDATGVRSSNTDIATAVFIDASNNEMYEAPAGTPLVATDGLVVVTGKSLGTVSLEVVGPAGQKTVMVEVYNTGPKTKGTVPGQSLGADGVPSPGVSTRTIDVKDYFTGADITYEASSSNDGDITAAITAGDLQRGTDHYW